MSGKIKPQEGPYAAPEPEVKIVDMPARQGYLERLSVAYVYPDYPTEDCVYCGEPATDKDHLLPRNWSGDSDRARVPIVPSCAECNRIFLNDTYEPDVIARRKICQEKIKVKYKASLKKILYVEEDLKQFGPQLRASIRQQIARGEQTRRRLAWPESFDYDHKAWKHAWEEKGELSYMKAPPALLQLFRVA